MICVGGALGPARGVATCKASNESELSRSSPECPAHLSVRRPVVCHLGNFGDRVQLGGVGGGWGEADD